MLELRVETDLQTALPSEIGFNFNELKAELAERLDHYNNLVVTEDGIKEAKADRAKLNKLRTAIDTRRKDIKKEYLKPYNEFESKIKELTVLIDQPIKAIDTQLGNYEEQRKEAKMAKIKEAYQENVPEDLKGIIPLDRIMDPRWLNVSTAIGKVVADINGWAQRVNADMLALDTIEPEYQAAVKQKYIETLDVSQAIAHRDALKDAEEAFRAREAERLAREEERRVEAEKRAQEAQKAGGNTNAQPTEEKPAEAPETARVERAGEDAKLYTLALEFQLTRTQAEALKNFLTSQRIAYRKI